jgi:hypothetical protein
MAQALSRRPVTAEARVRYQVIYIGFVMDRVTVGQVFLRVPRFSIPLAAQSKTWICGHSPVGIAGSNPAAGMDVCVF